MPSCFVSKDMSKALKIKLTSREILLPGILVNFKFKLKSYTKWWQEEGVWAKKMFHHMSNNCFQKFTTWRPPIVGSLFSTIQRNLWIVISFEQFLKSCILSENLVGRVFPLWHIHYSFYILKSIWYILHIFIIMVKSWQDHNHLLLKWWSWKWWWWHCWWLWWYA